MAEKMLVTQALDERDLLAKKIRDKIEKIRLVDCKKRNEDKTVTDRVSAEKFAKNAESAYQQIMDLIDRYQRLESAIIASNASTYVETSRGRLSVAAAIALRNRLKSSAEKEVNFEDILAFNLEEQYNEHLDYAETKNKGIETQAEAMRLSILGRDSRVKDDKPLGVVDAYIRENSTELIDPLNILQKIEASGISMGEKPPFTLTTELFLDSEPEAKTSHRVSGLPLTGSERNATMADRR